MRLDKYGKRLVLLSAFLVFSVFFVVSVSAQTSCWSYTSVADGCTSANDCVFKTDSWGSWCEELNCWSLATQTSCTDTILPGANCTWSAGGG